MSILENLFYYNRGKLKDLLGRQAGAEIKKSPVGSQGIDELHLWRDYFLEAAASFFIRRLLRRAALRLCITPLLAALSRVLTACMAVWRAAVASVAPRASRATRR